MVPTPGLEGYAGESPTRAPRRLPPQRLAYLMDAPAIAGLICESVLALFPAFYTAQQTASAARHFAHVDLQSIEDRTYYVHVVAGEIVACGGWSRRHTGGTRFGDAASDGRLLDPCTEAARVRAQFVREDWTRHGLGRAILASSEAAAREEGFSRLELVATLPSVSFYTACGFEATSRVTLTMPDCVTLAAVAMERPIEGPVSPRRR
jgi:GNAT superfamily N-acetyltransferase